MGKKIHVLYIFVMLIIMILPLLFLDREKSKISVIDNTYLPELPPLSEWRYAQDKLEDYVNKRIGFREQAVFLYEKGNGVLFHKLEHELYAFGENGHIMGNMDSYVRDYQHLNLEQDREFVNAFSEWLGKVNQYLEDEGITFLYFLAPDKKSIYPEGMSNTINIYGDVSRTDILLTELEKQGVPYIYPKEMFLEAKKEKKIYNLKYDVLHWNDFGNLLGNKMIDDYFQKYNSFIVPLDEKQFELEYEYKDRLEQSCYYIKEEVPAYGLKDESGICDLSERNSSGEITPEHYINENLPNAPTILIFHDSYMVASMKYYKGRYGEVVSVHNSNYWNIQALVEYYHPDIVLFENVERMLGTSNFDMDTMKSWSVER